jgi:hypothetical protein
MLLLSHVLQPIPTAELVAERLGHADSSTTSTIYAHGTKDQRREAAETFRRKWRSGEAAVRAVGRSQGRSPANNAGFLQGMTVEIGAASGI